MADGLEQIAALPDPVGEITDLKYRPSGIQVGRMRVPLGVVGIIYESRPNVTADAAALCLKSGNATILRGGSEALHSNQAIAACVHQGLRDAGLTERAVQVVTSSDRAAVGHLIADVEHVDVVIPRGGKSLIERIAKDAKVPGHQAPGWRLPRLSSMPARTRTWPSASPTTPRPSATRRATRWKRCSCIGQSPHACSLRWPPSMPRNRSSCAVTSARARWFRR